MAKKPVKKTISKKSKVSKPKKATIKKAVKKSAVKKKPAKKTAKKVIKKVVKRRARAKPPTEEQINDLVSKGRTRGFITETEILFVFPDIEEYIDLYDIFLSDRP